MVVDPIALAGSTFHVHLVDLWSHELHEMTRVLFNLQLVPLRFRHIDCPTLVKLSDQVDAFRMVNTIGFPALDELILELCGFL